MYQMQKKMRYVVLMDGVTRVGNFSTLSDAQTFADQEGKLCWCQEKKNEWFDEDEAWLIRRTWVKK